MIPRLDRTAPVTSATAAFMQSLAMSGFSGEIVSDEATRAVLSTDNSIYQITPQACVFPKHHEDVVRLMTVAIEHPEVQLFPRGGGTGTNAQSLGSGVVVDTSRHMNQILEINLEERWARVQCGVVKDHLNREVREAGLFFAPDLSTSNRATIGGMINTDASGQGSVRYGKTRDHVLALKAVMVTGEVIETAVLSDQDLDALPSNTAVGRVGRTLRALHDSHREAIDARFPRLNRCLTGYDLKHLRSEDGRLDLNAVLCGSEGTLAIITEAKINLEPLPSEVCLVAVQYGSFMDALWDAQELMTHGATSIETVDSKVLQLAMKDFVWDTVAEFFPEHGPVLQGVNLVEFTDTDPRALAATVSAFTTHLDHLIAGSGRPIAFTIARGRTQVNQIWAMRKRAVGLLGGVQSAKKPVAFVEDTCVPPENLAPYIAEFRELLDSHALDYGMFGHVDAGVLHVRPQLDLKAPESIGLIREITDAVVALTHKYHGLLWGEHGKGVRSEYAPLFFGDLYPVVCEVKALFDPANRLNPGKIAGPTPETPLLRIDEVPLRGTRDRLITEDLARVASTALVCNGNGACHNYDPDDRMCPSWKATRDRRHTPKGRAGLMREWVTRLSEQGVHRIPQPSPTQEILGYPAKWWRTFVTKTDDDFSHDVFEAMSGCLACKSCTGQCPIKVSVPTFRSQFLSAYYSRYARPIKDWLVGTLEFLLPVAAQVPSLYNGLIRSTVGQALFRHCGLVDSPLLSGIDPHRAVADAGFQITRLDRIQAMAKEDPVRFAKQVVVVQDAFTSYFETDLLLDHMQVLARLGFEPTLMPFAANGKPLHVHGFLGWFAQVANRQARRLQALDALGVALVGIDPSMTLTYRSEYRELGIEMPKVQLVQEFLATSLEPGDIPTRLPVRRYRLFAHCTEATNAKASLADWQTLFALAGQQLSVESIGCCGMAGTYGHERDNRDTSAKIYAQSWAPRVDAADTGDEILATGYSCRSQAKRFSARTLRHPISALREALDAVATQPPVS